MRADPEVLGPTTPSRAGVTSGHLVYMAMTIGTSALLMAYVVVAARSLEPVQFGQFSALFGIVVLFGAVFTGVQTYMAGSIAAAGRSARGAALRAGGRRLAQWCILVAAAFAVGSPAVAGALSTSTRSVWLVGLVCVLTLVWAALLGVLQGDERFAALAAVNAAQAGLRLLAMVAVVAAASVETILAATALSMVPALLVVVTVITTERPAVAGTTGAPWVARPALPTFLVTMVVGFPSVGDVVLARASLTAQGAADLAIVAVAGRVVVFFAAAVAVLAYPRFVKAARASDARPTLRLAVAGVVAGVVPLTAVVLWQPTFALSVLAGEAGPTTLALLPGYLMAAVLFAVCSPVCYYVLARSHPRRLVRVLVPILGAVTIGGLLVQTPGQLVMVLVAAGLALAGSLAVLVASDSAGVEP